MLPNVRVSCQLAVLWASLAEKTGDESLMQAAERLARFLFPIVSEGLMTLWTPEREYREEEDSVSTALFLQSVGHSEMSRDPMFQLQRIISIDEAKNVLHDPSIGYEFIKGVDAVLAISGAGWQTAAGSARVGEVEIPAFGPHVAPLSDGELFGIGPGEDGWFCAHAAKEVWLRVRGDAGDRSVNIYLDSVGVQPEKPIAFVFYIRADECRVDGRVFKPRSLTRYSGTAEGVEFMAKSSKMLFSTDPGLKIEIIPLAGDRDFWGASFLLAIWLPPFQVMGRQTITFRLSQGKSHSSIEDFPL
jgi:hypothetical protein